MTSTDTRNPNWRRRTLLAALITVVGLAGTVRASASADLVDLEVVNRDTGETLRIWHSHGRPFVAGAPGARYSLRVTNHTDGRVMVVMSVDGLNILTGETAGYGQNGYVLDAYQSYDATGWRKSNTEVAAFAFTPLPHSYAARTGRPGDVGVVGMAVFRERIVPPPPPPPPPAAIAVPSDADAYSRRAFSLYSGTRIPAPNLTSVSPMAAPPPPPMLSKPSAGAAVASPRTEKLGTAHGAREWSVVHDTVFERATSYPETVLRIEYDSYANLVASGVIPAAPDTEHRPRPFPRDPDGRRFVPDPPPEP